MGSSVPPSRASGHCVASYGSGDFGASPDYNEPEQRQPNSNLPQKRRQYWIQGKQRLSHPKLILWWSHTVTNLYRGRWWRDYYGPWRRYQHPDAEWSQQQWEELKAHTKRHPWVLSPIKCEYLASRWRLQRTKIRQKQALSWELSQHFSHQFRNTEG